MIPSGSLAGRRGFTLLEIVITILIIGILATVAIPVFHKLNDEAQQAAEDSIIGSVKEGIKNYYLQSILQARIPAFPATLDNASKSPASLENQFFINVLKQPGIYDSQWLKVSDTVYQSPLENIYTYSPFSGIFSKSGSFSAITNDGQVYSAPVATVVDTFDTGQFSASNGGLYTPWSGTPLDFTFNFANAGNYQFQISAINNADHPYFTSLLGQPLRSGWTLPTGYTQFNVRAAIDGVVVSPVNFGISASDTTFNSNGFTAHVSAGAHTLSLTWLNDEWVPASNQDANIQYQNVLIQSQ